MASKKPRRSDRSDIRFEIYGPNNIYYQVCLDLLLNFDRKKEERRRTQLISTRVVGFAATKNKSRPLYSRPV